MKQNLEEIVKLSYLYDFYGPLLKEKNREIFEEYVLNDLSLSEIAGQYGITRQGVYDIVKRCTGNLEIYEEKLKLFERFQQAKKRLERLEEMVKEDGPVEREEILNLTREIYDIL